MVTSKEERRLTELLPTKTVAITIPAPAKMSPAEKVLLASSCSDAVRMKTSDATAAADRVGEAEDPIGTPIDKGEATKHPPRI